MKIYQKIIRNAPRSRYSPAGKTGVLKQTIFAECWNFTTGERWALHPGQRIRVCHVNDAEHFTCLAVNCENEAAGIELSPGRIGHRFIIANHDLRKAIPELRPIPRRNFDLIGAIIAAES